MKKQEVILLFKLSTPYYLTTTGEEFGHPIESHINYLDKSKSSPLHLAVRGGNVEAIRFCIASGGKVDQQQVPNVQTKLNEFVHCSRFIGHSIPFHANFSELILKLCICVATTSY